MSLPSDAFSRQIFFEIHSDLPRQGPGTIQSTIAALSSIPRSGDHQHLAILDIGCGTGAASLQLANMGHHVTCLDNSGTFLESLTRKARKEGLLDYIHIQLGDMFNLETILSRNTFDVIWSEGSIYIIGFERGLTEWKPLLKPNCYLACSELSWLSSNPPLEAQEFWSKNYPGMLSRQTNIDIIKQCGYDLVDSFVLSECAWEKEYYRPMEKKIEELKLKYEGQKEVDSVLREQQAEINMYRKYSDSYGYVFYIMKKL